MGTIYLGDETSSQTPPTGQKSIFPKDDILRVLDESGNDVPICGGTIYIGGAPDTDGTWRLVLSGDRLLIQKRESGTYVTKGSFL